MTISQETIGTPICPSPAWWRAWRDSAEVVLAELLEIPAAYIVLDFELPGGDAGNCWGVTWPGLGRNFQATIGERWRGSGPGMILATVSLERHLAGLFVEDLADCLQAMAWGVCAHEVAHWLEFVAVYLQRRETSQIPAAIQTRPGCELAVDPRAKVLDRILPLCGDGDSAWSCLHSIEADIGAELVANVADLSARSLETLAIEHGPRFCWNCLHVLARLEARGINACLISAIDYELFGLPVPAHVMRQAIRADLAACLPRPLTDVAMLELPSGFLDLFESSEERICLMSTTEFFANLKAAEKANENNALEQWEALVTAVANGGDQLDFGAVVDILKSLDKTNEQLESAVQRLLQRRKLAARLQEMKAAQAKRPQLEARRNELFKLREERHKAVDGEIALDLNPVLWQLEQITQSSPLIISVTDQLLRLSEDSDANRRCKEIEAVIAGKRRQQSTITDKLDERRELRSDVAGQAPHKFGEEPTEEAIDAALASRITELRGQWTSLDNEIKELEARADAERARMLSLDLI